MRFEWDENKNAGNQRKHGLSFQTAQRIFDDPALFSEQDQFVDGEERWRSIGLIGPFLIVLVAHTIIDGINGSEIIRIISARKAEPRERRQYERAKNRSV